MIRTIGGVRRALYDAVISETDKGMTAKGGIRKFARADSLQGRASRLPLDQFAYRLSAPTRPRRRAIWSIFSTPIHMLRAQPVGAIESLLS